MNVPEATEVDRGPGGRPRSLPVPCAASSDEPPGAHRDGSVAQWCAALPEEGYKRVFDLTAIALVFGPALPLWLVLGAGIALAIRLEDGGPVLYRQARLGRRGRVFSMLKFRSMVVDAERRTGPVWARCGDARSTAVGRVLRRFHLDELPQLLNVLRGEMSLVGPRPERPELAARIERRCPGFARRLSVRPGIAGLAQARRPYAVAARHKLRYDLLYIGAMGPWLDLKLCVLCVWKALRPRARRPVTGDAGQARPGPRLGGPLGAHSVRTGL